MRLEFEPKTVVLPLVDDQAFDPAGFSSDLETLLKKGIAAAQSGERDQARKLLSQASAIDPECEDAWMWLASISEYPEELLAFLDRVLSINPENSRALEWRQATRALLAKTFVQRAAAALNGGSTELAEKCVNQALSYDAGCNEAWYLRALMADSDDEQLELFHRVLEADPNHEAAKDAVAAILAARSQAAFEEAKSAAVDGDHSRAIEILDAFLEDTPEAVDAWILRSHLSQSLEQKIEALEKALEIDPENAAARSGLAFLALTFGSNNAQAESSEVEELAERSDSKGVEASSYDLTNETEQEVELTDNVESVTSISAVAESADVEAELTAHPTAGSFHHTEESADACVEDFSTEVELADTETATAEFANEGFNIDESDEPEPARSLEELSGLQESVVDPENETVENLAPFVNEVLVSEGYSLDQVESVDHFHDQTQHYTEQEVQTGEPSGSEFDLKFDGSSTGVSCPFCSSANDHQSFTCSTCNAALTLADIEALFEGQKADREVIQEAVTQMEAEWNLRELTDSELTYLGIGHFNLGNYEVGLKYLHEAARLDPNNVILGGQVNAVAIRLEELRRQLELNESKPTGKTILVVDDSPTVRKLISGKLEKSGHIVVCAADGIEALEQLENGLPDLVLLDITMPRMDGYEVCKQIRSNPSAKDLPVVMISGKDGFFDKVRGRMAGSTGYVTKPFGPETLMKALETYLLPEA